MDRTGSAFKYLAKEFLPLSEAKIKEGSFCGSSHQQTLQRRYVQQPTSERGEKLLGRVSSCVTNFLGNIRAENYKQLFEDMSTVSHTWLQHVLKAAHASFPLGLLPR
jgi:hypothetical protein